MGPLPHLASREQRDVALFVVAAAAQRLGPVMILPLLLAHLTLAEYGTFGLVQSAIALLPLLVSFNVPAVITRAVFDPPADRRAEHAASLVVGTVVTITALSAVVALSAVFALKDIASVLAVDRRGALWLVGTVIVGSAGSAFLQLSYGLWRATLRPVRAVIANLTSSSIVLAIVAYSAARDSLDVFVAATAIAVANFAIGLLSLSRPVLRAGLLSVPRLHMIRSAVARSIPVLGYTLGMWVLTAGGRWIGLITLQLEDVAHFTAATQLSVLLSVLGRCAYEAWSPVVYAFHSSGDAPAGQAFLARRAALGVGVMLLAAVAAMGVASAFIATYAPRYMPVVPLLPIVLVAPVMDMAHLRHHTSLMASGRLKAIAGYTTCSLMIFAAGGFIGAARFGLRGLCVAFSSAYLSQWLLASIADRRARPRVSGATPVPVSG